MAALLVRLYQLSLGRLVPPRCRFHPSCSEYTRLALIENGLFFGGFQAVRRLARCAPWSPGGIDEVRRIGAGSGHGPLRRIARARADGHRSAGLTKSEEAFRG